MMKNQNPKNPSEELVWWYSREIARIAHVHYGVELTVSEVCTSIHKDVGYDPERAWTKMYLLSQDPREMRKWLRSMMSSYNLAFKIHWGAWIGLAFAWFLVAIGWI